MAWLNRLNKSIMILRKDFIVVCLFILSIILDSKFAICEKMSSRYTGWVSEGVFTSVDNNTALSECRMSIPTGINPEDVIKVSYSCKSGDYISYFGANNDIIDHGSIVHMDEIQTLRIGCSDGSSFISFGGSKINHYNNTSTGFPIIVTTLSAGFTNSGPGRIPSFVFMEGSFLQLSTFSIKRRVHNIEPTNIRRWTGESFKGGCFALLPISQPGNTIYAIVGMGFVGVGVVPSSLNYLKKGIQIKNMIYKVGSLLSECQTLKGPGLDHKNNSTTYYSVMCPNGHFNKYRTYKKYSFGTTTLASIEIECKDYGLKVENSIHNSMIRLGEHKSGPWITHERVGNLTSVYVAYFNSTSKENCKGSSTCNPIALRYYDNNGKEFSTFLNTELSVQRSLKRKVAIRERLWVGKDPSVICAGVDKNGHITGIGFGYKEMIEPIPLLIDAVKMVKPDIISYPLSLHRNQTINTAISYNPDEMQVSFLSSKITGCNNSYSPNKNSSSKSTVQVHAQCKYDSNGTPQYIGKIILFLDNATNELTRIGGICTNGNKHSHNSHLGSATSSNSISGTDSSVELDSRTLKSEDDSKIISMFDKDKWPVNKWAPSPLRVQHSSLYKNKEYESSEVFQNSIDLSFAFGQSISPSISVISSESGPFNSIYLGYNSESLNPIMLTTRLNQLDSSKRTLLMQYSSFLAPSTITYWETPTVDDQVTYTDSICVELEQKNGNIVGIGFEGSMSSVPYDSLDDSVKVVKAVVDNNGKKSLEVENMEVVSEDATHIKNSGNITEKRDVGSNVGSKMLVENRINKERCPKLAINKALIEHLEEMNKSRDMSTLNNDTKNSEDNDSEVGVPFTITCPECTEIEFIKAHYIIDGPIIGLEWKCTGLNKVDTLFLGGRSPSQVTTQIFNKVQPKMIEVAFFESSHSENNRGKSKHSPTKGMPGPGLLSIDGYIGSGKIQQLLYYRMKDTNFGPTVTWESNEKLRVEKHVLRTVCGILSTSQAILGLGFGFEYLPLECSSKEIKPNFIPVDNQHSNRPTVVINGARISQRVDMLHPNCSPIQGGSAKTRLSNWVISFSCLNDEMNEEVPFSGISALRSVFKNMNGTIKVLTLFCPDQKTSVSVGENDSDASQLTSQYLDISKPGYSLSIDFSPLIVVPTQIKMNPPYSSPSTAYTTIASVSGFNQISTSSDSIYGVCFELTSDGKIAGIAFANKPSPHNPSRKKSKKL